MDNTMKLLMALCEYWGIEVEEIKEYKETEIPLRLGVNLSKRMLYDPEPKWILVSHGGEYKRGEDESYFQRLVSPIVDYKLTKKEWKGPNPNFRDNMRMGTNKD